MIAKKILVTGGAGYIGIPLVEKLLDKNYAVRIFDRLYWGKKPLKHLKGKIEIIQGDIRRPPPSILDDVSGVIHLAAFSNDPMADYDPETNYEVNTQGTKIIAQLCKKRGVRRFIFASSASLYDRGLTTNAVLRNENSKINPKAIYSISKQKAEQVLLKLNDQDFCPIILRKGTVYGFSPRMRYDLVVNTFTRDALLSKKLMVFCQGVQHRPLVDVRDVAKAYIACLEAPEKKVKGEIFNLVYKNYQVLEVAQGVKKAFAKINGANLEIEVDFSPRKDRNYKMSGAKIKKTLGWQPSIPAEKSVENMAREIQKHGFVDFMHPRYYNIEWMMPFLRKEKNRKKNRQ